MQYSPVLLMCKDTAVYDVTKNIVLNKNLLPGCILHGTMDYSSWMRTRYSSGSNVSARRLMLRAFASDNHANAIKATRTLSLSDCYWLKQEDEEVLFSDVTPYLHKEWDGTGIFTGGSISTLFVNGNADKRWIDSDTLLKVGSYKEMEPYTLCSALDLEHTAKVKMSDNGIVVTNFTTTDYFLESMEQSGLVKQDENPREKAVEIFGERITALFTIDYLVEHDDRHWGNYGFLRNANTGEYIGMAPYYDFDWAWSDGVVYLPAAAWQKYYRFIRELCERAVSIAGNFEHGTTIIKRAKELLEMK